MRHGIKILYLVLALGILYALWPAATDDTAPSPSWDVRLDDTGRLRVLGEQLENLRVRDTMTWVVVQTHPEAPLAHAALVMSERRVGSLPVVEGGKLVGLLTERDVLRALSREGTVPEFDPDGFLW